MHKDHRTDQILIASFFGFFFIKFPFQSNGFVQTKEFIFDFVCLFYSGFTSLQQSLSHITIISGCGRELNAHF